TRAVRADLYSGAELLELGRLLIDIDAEALPDQDQRRGQGADASADDCNVLVYHGVIGPELSCPRRWASSKLRACAQKLKSGITGSSACADDDRPVGRREL